MVIEVFLGAASVLGPGFGDRAHCRKVEVRRKRIGRRGYMVVGFWEER